MQSPTDPDPLARIEQRLAEMQRRTMSTLTVTNPADGVAYLDISGSRLRMRDSNGTFILANQGPPSWGYLNPWQNYVLFPFQPPVISNALTGPMQNTALATLYPNQARMSFTVTTVVSSSTGGIADTQVVYTVNGGSPVTIAASVGTTASTTGVTSSWEYVWPADYFGDKIKVMFQARIRPGTGDPLNDYAIYAPSRLYGKPQ